MSSDSAREQILAAAGPVFAEKGYQATTVREICKSADVNLAAVNYHFGDKKRLYLEAVRLAHQNRAREVPMPNWAADVPPSEKLSGFVATLLTRILEDQTSPWQMRLMMREVLTPTDACRHLVEDYIRPHFEMLLGIVDELVPQPTTVAERHRIAFSIIGQCIHYRVGRHVVSMLIPNCMSSVELEIDRLTQHIVQFTLAAIQGVGFLIQSGEAVDFEEVEKHG